MPHKVKVPASVASLDLDRVRRALFKADGNITKAAKSLKVKSADLRRLTWRHPKLIMDALERVHCHDRQGRGEFSQGAPRRSSGAVVAGGLFILSHSACGSGAWLVSSWRRFSDYDYSPPPAAAPTVVIWAGDMPPGYRPSLPAVPEARRLSERRRHRRWIPRRTSGFTEIAAISN